MRKFKELGELKTGNGKWCNNATFQYYTERMKNDINGNARYKITILLFTSVLSFTAQCQNFQCKELAERFVNNYLETGEK